MKVTAEKHWENAVQGLSKRYQSWDLVNTWGQCPIELHLARPVLQRYLAVRLAHGDFAWYHKKYQHEDARLHCSCGAAKAPDHLVHCPKILEIPFAKWPWPSARRKIRPRDRVERKRYLRDLMEHPLAFAKWLEVTSFYSKICPR